MWTSKRSDVMTSNDDLRDHKPHRSVQDGPVVPGPDDIVSDLGKFSDCSSCPIIKVIQLRVYIVIGT